MEVSSASPVGHTATEILIIQCAAYQAICYLEVKEVTIDQRLHPTLRKVMSVRLPLQNPTLIKVRSQGISPTPFFQTPISASWMSLGGFRPCLASQVFRAAVPSPRVIARLCRLLRHLLPARRRYRVGYCLSCVLPIGDTSTLFPYTTFLVTRYVPLWSSILTLASTVCHFSPTRVASICHISGRILVYSLASISIFPPSHFSSPFFSISLSCRLRQALPVLSGKCFCARGAQRSC